MRLWVTGARGFIGRHVCAIAAAQGHEVYPVISPNAQAPLPPGGEVIRVRLDDQSEVLARATQTRPDAVIHLAWYANPVDYLRSIENIASLTMTISFAQAVLNAGCRRLLVAGTCLEYAALPHPRSEEDPIDPRSLYARCKHAAHLVLRELFDRESATLGWARLFHMHGPGEHPSRLIPASAVALRNGQPFAISPGEQIRDHLDVRDVAGALVHLVSMATDGPVNVCSGRPVTLRSVLETVGSILRRPELLLFGARPYMVGEVMNLCGSSIRLQQSGFQPSFTDLRSSLAEAIAAPVGTA